MKLLEIKNNLVKISYNKDENPILGRFVVLSSVETSYVAQLVNLKSDTVNNFAIAKLLFTFTPDGVVDNYDGSIPDINAELSLLPADELLNLLPSEIPIKMGKLAQQDCMLSLDVSVFEQNLTVFSERNTERKTFISNCIRQLFQLKEKSIIIDDNNMFEDYQKIKLARDFKLPLNSKMIDYLFEYELSEVEPATKAVIQDIFYAVQQYIKTLDFEFLPIDNFVDVVANQYKEMQMPELALLKNKLLKYRDANIFANTKDEVLALNAKLEQKNCIIIDLQEVNETLEKQVISYIHSIIAKFDKFVYLFVQLTDENSDKQLLKQLINNNHVFTVFLARTTYKYAQELKQYAQNMILFAPQTLEHDFAAFNTFISKLNPEECIVYGKLTQGIPFIVDMSNLELDLTQDDVLGDKYQFVPATEELVLVKTDSNSETTSIETNKTDSVSDFENDEFEDSTLEEEIPTTSIPAIEQPPIEVVDEPQENIEQTDSVSDEDPIKIGMNAFEPYEADDMLDAEPQDNLLMDDSNLMEPLSEAEELAEADEGFGFGEEENLTENDLDFMENNQELQSEDMFDNELSEPKIDENLHEKSEFDQNLDVPVYPADEAVSDEDLSAEIGFERGDSVNHPRYGRGVIEKIIKYGNKTLCSISFENVGRRLLDPSVSELIKLN